MDYNFLYRLFYKNAIEVSVAFVAVLVFLLLLKLIFRKSFIVEIIWMVYLVIFVFALIYITIISRMRSTPVSNPLIYFYMKKDFNKNDLKELIGNIVLFLPYGAGICILLKSRHPLVLTALAGLLTSMLIELSQLILQCGYIQISDLVTNTLGTIIGCIMSLFVIGINKKRG